MSRVDRDLESRLSFRPVTRHVAPSTGRFEIVGRMLFGSPAGPPIV